MSVTTSRSLHCFWENRKLFLHRNVFGKIKIHLRKNQSVVYYARRQNEELFGLNPEAGDRHENRRENVHDVK